MQLEDMEGEMEILKRSMLGARGAKSASSAAKDTGGGKALSQTTGGRLRNFGAARQGQGARAGEGNAG